MSAAPTRARRPSPIRLDSVLSAVRPGHAWVLSLTPDERRLLDDRDGRLALSILQHLLDARRRVVRGRSWEPTPLTGDTVRRVGLRLGVRLGEHRCLRLVRRLRQAGVIVPAGSYRDRRSGYRVMLWAAAGRAATRVLRTPRVSIRRTSGTRRLRHAPWWAHPLFGNPDGRPPPGADRRTLQRWQRNNSGRDNGEAAA